MGGCNPLNPSPRSASEEGLKAGGSLEKSQITRTWQTLLLRRYNKSPAQHRLDWQLPEDAGDSVSDKAEKVEEPEATDVVAGDLV